MGSLGSGFAIFFQPIGRQETRAGARNDAGTGENLSCWSPGCQQLSQRLLAIRNNQGHTYILHRGLTIRSQALFACSWGNPDPGCGRDRVLWKEEDHPCGDPGDLGTTRIMGRSKRPGMVVGNIKVGARCGAFGSGVPILGP